ARPARERRTLFGGVRQWRWHARGRATGARDRRVQHPRPAAAALWRCPSLRVSQWRCRWTARAGRDSLPLGEQPKQMSTSAKVQLVVDDFGGDASAVTRLIGLEPTAVGMADGTVPNPSG